MQVNRKESFLGGGGRLGSNVNDILSPFPGKAEGGKVDSPQQARFSLFGPLELL